MSRSRRRGTWQWVAATLLLDGLACSPAPPPAPSSTPPPVAPVPGAPGPGAPRVVEPRRTEAELPAASLDRGCEVAVRTRVVPLGKGRYELIARAGNETERQLEVELLYDCPGTAARFDGLPPGYDLGNQCQAGACTAGTQSRQRLALPPGGSSEISRVTLDTSAGPCNAELPTGSYSIGASARVLGAQSCSTSRGTFQHAARAVQTPAPARPPARRQRPPAPAPPEKEPPCPPMACQYTPCPPGVEPPDGCARVCGCLGQELRPTLLTAPAPPR